MIKIQNLKKAHGSQEILRDISLEVQKGDVAVIIGPSGTGKSTFLRCLNGLESFDDGVIDIGGITLHRGLLEPELRERVHAARRRMGMVFQQFHLFPHLSVIQNIMEAPVRVAGLSIRDARAKAEQLLSRVGLVTKANERPIRLSGGEQQRVAIARALAMDPEVILFDEPTSALDPRTTDEVTAVMADLARNGQTMVVVTHDMAFARQVANVVHVFGEGRVTRSGTPAQVLDDASDYQRPKLVSSLR
jgi:ABC-type polar amino acid transport system ATPase subunit